MAWRPYDYRCAQGHEVECWLSSPDATPAQDDAERRCNTCGGAPVERLSAVESYAIREREFSAIRERHGTNYMAGMRPDSTRLYFGQGQRSRGVGRDRRKEFIAEQRARHAPRTWLED